MTEQPAKLAVLISGNGSNLQSIIDHINKGLLNAEIVCVISNNSKAYGLSRAQKHGLANHCIDQNNYSNKSKFESSLLKTLSCYKPNLIILAGFMRVLSADFVNHYKNLIINIHPSLLPKYKGLDTHARVLADGGKQHGASVHVVTSELDSGAIIIQKMFQIENDDTIESLQQKVHKIEHVIYSQAIKLYIDANFQPRRFSKFLTNPD